jgi:uncharacterized membrane-anchored protein YitT (DUF2179 family)
MKKNIIEFIQIVVGTFLMAMSVSLFLLPNQLSSGGFTGIATITYYLLKLPMGLVILVLNIPLFILAFIKKGGKFFVKGIIGTVFLSVFIDILDKYPVITNDKLLASIYGGVIAGLGTSITLKANASTGGTDMMVYVIRAYKPELPTGNLMVIIDTIIVVLNVVFFKNIEVGLYSTIAIFIMGKMVDIVFEGINFTKLIYIISDKYMDISNEIINELERGITGIYAKGMYTNDDKMMLLCVASRNQAMKIKEISKKIDPKSFVIISNAREAYGLGFKKE